MGTIVLTGGLIVDLVIVLTLLISGTMGLKKGLTSVIFKLVIFLASLIIAFLIYKPVANFIMEKTGIDEWLTEKIAATLDGTSISEGELLDVEQSNISKSVVELINKFVKEALNETKVNAVNYVSAKLAYYGITILTLIFLLGILRFVLACIKGIAEFIAKLPILNIINGAGGLVYGLLRGLIALYLLMAILSIISPMIESNFIIKSINDSKLGSIMYNNNILLNLITK